MSKQAVRRFRQAVNASPDLQQQLLNAGAGLDVVSFAERHGYDFSEADLQAVVDEAGDESLSDFELRLAAGGSGTGKC